MVINAVESVGLLDKIKSKPNQLSGGQCQRTAIARAITKNPKIFKILKSTALCFLCVRTEAVEVNIVMKNAVPTAKCIV